MAVLLANDGLAASAQAKLEALGHTVDTAKYEGDALLKRLGEVDAVIVRSATKIRQPEIEAGAQGRLKLIVRAGVGIDNIDVDAAKAKGLMVRNTPQASSNAVAELAFASMLALAHNVHAANVSMHRGEWLKKQYEGSELTGKTLGLLGFGRIAQNLAQKALAFGMSVVYDDLLDAGMADCEKRSFDEVLAAADFLSIHMPSIGRVLLDRDALAKMKDGVFIINTARGDLIDEDALMDAIDAGHVAGAALDVFQKEPLKNERLIRSDKVSLTPHIGAATREAQDRIGDIIVEIVKETF